MDASNDGPTSRPITRPDSGGRDSGTPDFRCEPPRELCGGFCVNTQTAVSHCGGCNLACRLGERCREGTCTTEGCGTSELECAGGCVDPMTDREHCGECDQACDTGEECIDGACRCPEGFTRCGDACVNTETDRAHCGECDQACAARESCRTGECEGAREASCADGLDDDGDGAVDCADDDCVGSTRSCENTCGTGVETCESGGEWSACAGGAGETEICGDGIDQDCDGEDLRAPDAHEPNDTCDDCRSLSLQDDPTVSLTARFDAEGDTVDCFKLDAIDDAPLGEQIEVAVTDIPEGHDYAVFLYRGVTACTDLRAIAQSDAAGNGDELLLHDEGTDGNDSDTYFIRVVRRVGHSCTEGYRLFVTGLQ